MIPELLRIKSDAEARAKKELALTPNRVHKDDWQSLQLSRISSYFAPIKLPLRENDEGIDIDVLERFSDRFHQMMSYAFGHCCVTTPFDDFVYILSVEKDERVTDAGRFTAGGVTMKAGQRHSEIVATTGFPNSPTPPEKVQLASARPDLTEQEAFRRAASPK